MSVKKYSLFHVLLLLSILYTRSVRLGSGFYVDLSIVVNILVAVHVQQLVVHRCISLVFCIYHKVALTVSNLLGAHKEESVLQVWVADFFTNKMNKFACLVMFTIQQAVGVEEISAETHHQLPEELRLLVGGLVGQSTFVAAPDVCRHYLWCFQNKSYDTKDSVCICQSDLRPSFSSLLWWLLSFP